MKPSSEIIFMEQSQTYHFLRPIRWLTACGIVIDILDQRWVRITLTPMEAHTIRRRPCQRCLRTIA